MPKWDDADLAAVVSSPVPYGFDAVVVYPDAQGQPAYQTPQMADQSYGGRDEALKTAVMNTAPNELVAIAPSITEIDGHPLTRYRRPGNPFVTTMLLTVGRVLPAGAVAGVLLIVPAFSELIMRPLTLRDDLDAAPMMTAMARERF